MAGSELSSVVTMICRLLMNDTLRRARRARTARSVLKMRSRRKILGFSPAAICPNTISETTSTMDKITMTRSKLFHSESKNCLRHTYIFSTISTV